MKEDLIGGGLNEFYDIYKKYINEKDIDIENFEKMVINYFLDVGYEIFVNIIEIARNRLYKNKNKLFNLIKEVLEEYGINTFKNVKEILKLIEKYLPEIKNQNYIDKLKNFLETLLQENKK